MSVPTIQPHRRMELIDARVTLNGKPARICGWRRKFATVVQLESGLSCQWAWGTVDHIVSKCEGKFKS